MRVVKSLVITLLVLLPVACGAPENEDDHVPPPPEPKPIKNSGPVTPPTEFSCTSGTRYTYTNFIRGFLQSYCTTCHSAALPEEDRFGATADVNFDSYGDILRWRAQALDRTFGENPDMPPDGFMTSEDQAAFKKWLTCGTPE